MQSDAKETGLPLIKRSAWLGVKISLMILGPICLLCWVAVGGLVLYKSISLGISPIELMRSADAMSPPGSPSHLSRIADGLIASAELLVVGVTFSALTGAIIGMIAVGIRSMRSS